MTHYKMFSVFFECTVYILICCRNCLWLRGSMLSYFLFQPLIYLLFIRVILTQTHAPFLSVETELI